MTTIRLGTPSDAVALAELAETTFRDTFAADNKAEDMDAHCAETYGAAQQGAELLNPNIVTLLVEMGDQLAAFAQLRSGVPPKCVQEKNSIELWRFYVRRSWHGRGVAKPLMERVESDARQLGAQTLWLGVWEHNERAKAFYRKNGFVDVGSHIYMVGADAQTDRIMTRTLDDFT